MATRPFQFTDMEEKHTRKSELLLLMTRFATSDGESYNLGVGLPTLTLVRRTGAEALDKMDLGY